MARDAASLMTIGAFSRRSRLSLKALRLYDRVGLLKPADTNLASGYRRYHETQLTPARLIAMLRRLDLPLAEIATIVAAPKKQAAARLATYWEELERRMAGQRELAAYLRSRLLGENGDLTFAQVRLRHVAAQTVMTERANVYENALPRWIGSAMGRLHNAARGRKTGHPFVVYYGEINEDSDGPAEACWPVKASRTSRSMKTRLEPAHREAYLRLTKAQVGFPQIGSAYETLYRWAEARGLEVVGAPREIYFADFPLAHPADQVCDVALPIAGRASAVSEN